MFGDLRLNNGNEPVVLEELANEDIEGREPVFSYCGMDMLHCVTAGANKIDGFFDRVSSYHATMDDRESETLRKLNEIQPNSLLMRFYD